MAPDQPKKREHPWLTYGLVVFLVIVYALELRFPIDGIFRWNPTGPTLVAFGALDKEVIWGIGQWYRIIAAPFLSGSTWAIAFNVINLLLLAPYFEKSLGRAWFFALVFSCAIGGSLMAFALNPLTTTSVGMPGVIWGLSITICFFSFRLAVAERDPLQLRVLFTLIFFMWPIVISLQKNSNIVSYGGHLGGMLIGILFGLMLLKHWPAEQKEPPFPKAALWITIVGSLLLITTIIAAGLHYPARIGSGGDCSLHMVNHKLVTICK